MKRRQTVEPSPYMTVKEVAAYLRIHRSTVYMLLRDNQLPAFKIGSDWRFVRESIDKWIADRYQKKSPRGSN